MERQLILLSVLILIGLGSAKRLKLSSCGGKGYFKVHSIDVTPYPPTFPGKATITVDSEMIREVDGPFDVNIKAWRYTSFFWYKIPCSKLGKCHYKNACSQLQKAAGREQVEAFLGLKFDGCTLPKYERRTISYSFDLPRQKESIMSNARGYTFSVQLSLMKGGQKIACNEIQFLVGY